MAFRETTVGVEVGMAGGELAPSPAAREKAVGGGRGEALAGFSPR